MTHTTFRYLTILLCSFVAVVCSTMAFSKVSRPKAIVLPPTSQPIKKSSDIEVVFVLDTTGSMSGLIAGAKQKIWSIVNELANAKPTPKIKVGLVAYRDRRDAYVTKVFQMTNDLDAIYQSLTAFRAQGGGDTPEHVNLALYHGVHKIKWSNNPNTLKLLFLVGDAPPHMDYTNDIRYPVTLQKAVKKGIIVNTIRCGNMASTAVHWNKIAKMGKGNFLSIKQNGHSRTIKTPYDKKITRVGRLLQKTYIVYGSGSIRSKLNAQTIGNTTLTEKNAETSAARYSYNAKRSSAGHGWGTRDLLARYNKNPGCLNNIPAKHLPKKLAKMNLKQRIAFMNKLNTVRAKLQKKLAQLSRKREGYIKKKLQHKKDSFDYNVLHTIKKQAKQKNIRF